MLDTRSKWEHNSNWLLCWPASLGFVSRGERERREQETAPLYQSISDLPSIEKRDNSPVTFTSIWTSVLEEGGEGEVGGYWPGVRKLESLDCLQLRPTLPVGTKNNQILCLTRPKYSPRQWAGDENPSKLDIQWAKMYQQNWCNHLDGNFKINFRMHQRAKSFCWVPSACWLAGIGSSLKHYKLLQGPGMHTG